MGSFPCKEAFQGGLYLIALYLRSIPDNPNNDWVCPIFLFLVVGTQMGPIDEYLLT